MSKGQQISCLEFAHDTPPPATLNQPCRPRPERGGDTVEYIIVLLVVLVIGGALLAFSGTMGDQVTKTGQAVDSWFSKAGVQNKPSNSAGSGADSSISEELLNKDPADWTLDDQKKVAEDISAKGNSSKLYSKAKGAMDADTTWSVTLASGEEMKYKIIGMNHDDLADGSGKAGLTFMAVNDVISSRMNATEPNVGGWEKSELRRKMNSGEIWNLMPTELQGKVKAVTKLTNNVGGGDANKGATVTATQDKLFLLSYSEIDPTSYWASDYPWTSQEGTQYEYFKGKVTNHYINFRYGFKWWERTVCPTSSGWFLGVNYNTVPSNFYTVGSFVVLPAWCF